MCRQRHAHPQLVASLCRQGDKTMGFASGYHFRSLEKCILLCIDASEAPVTQGSRSSNKGESSSSSVVCVSHHGPACGRLFVAHHLGAPLAVVEVVGDADHARRAHVVCRGGLDGAGAAHAAQDLDRGDGAGGGGIHAVSEAGDRS